MNTFEQLTPMTRTRRTRRLVAAAACAAAVAAPVVGLTASAGNPPSRPMVAPAVTPTPARTPALPASGALALPNVAVNVDLCATTGSVVLPWSSGAPTTTSVPVWGYVPGDCTTGTGTATLGAAPTITAAVGDTVTVTLHNSLAVPTSLSFGGQTMPTDTAGAAANGGTKTYTFTPTHPGATLYHAGFAGDTAIQTAMGMYGVLEVLSSTPGQAFDSAATAYDVSTPVVVGEVDPALNTSANPSTFDMRKFAAKWTTLNGKVFPDAAALANADPDQTVLLRYLNAGIDYHSMSLLGGNQQIIAEDGNARAYPYSVVAQTVGPGQGFDALVHVSANAGVGTQLTVFEGSLQVRNRNRRPAGSGTFRTYGGAMGFITVGGTANPNDTTGPVASGLTVNVGTGEITATINDTTTGGSSILAAEYSIDTVAPAGTGTAMAASDGGFTSVSELVTATATLPSGQHTVYVRGQDANGNWGQATAKSILIDLTGPTVSTPTLTPNPASGSVTVALHATASDTATGNAAIQAARYTVDGGAPVSMTVLNPTLPTSSIDATIPAGLSAGDHIISIEAQDALGNWSAAPATITLTITTAGPTTSNVVATPNPTNGLIGVNSTTAALRVTASANKPGGVVNRAEGFIDTVGANGTGFPFVPVDGQWNSATEAISVDIPLANIRALADGMHTISVHARDSVGNWGAVVPVQIMVDKTVPTASAVIVTTGTNSATVQATAADVTAGGVQSGVGRVEFYVDTDPGLGAGTAMTLVSGSTYSAAIPVVVLSEGTHTVVVRSRDVAGNWSTNASTTFSVVRSLYFSTFGNTNPPGVAGTADDADVYRWAGSPFTRFVDVTAVVNPVPATANVDGLKVDTASHFWVSFADNTTLPVLGAVQDEDIVEYNAGTWTVRFDGTGNGLTTNNLDIDAFDIVGTDIYFSTVGNSNPPGVAGTADDADVYLWNGAAFSRALDVTTKGVPGGANVDGLSVVDATHLFVSFGADTTVTGPGAVQDEDILYYNNGTWSVWFDGTAKGLTNNNHDLDAIDVI